MTSDDIQLLYQYDRWANNRVLKTVSDDQFRRDLGGSFRSVRDTLVHISHNPQLLQLTTGASRIRLSLASGWEYPGQRPSRV